MAAVDERRLGAYDENGKIRWGTAVALVGINTIVLLAGVWSTFNFTIFGKELGFAGLAVALALMGLVTFLLLFTDSTDIRTAIAGAFTVLYLGFVTASFNTKVGEVYANETGFLKGVYENLTNFMVVIVGFYFGGKSVEIVAARLGRRNDRVNEVPRSQEPSAPVEPRQP